MISLNISCCKNCYNHACYHADRDKGGGVVFSGEHTKHCVQY